MFDGGAFALAAAVILAACALAFAFVEAATEVLVSCAARRIRYRLRVAAAAQRCARDQASQRRCGQMVKLSTIEFVLRHGSIRDERSDVGFLSTVTVAGAHSNGRQDRKSRTPSTTARIAAVT